MKKWLITFVLALSVLLFSFSNDVSAAWFTGTIYAVVVKGDGSTVIVLVDSGGTQYWKPVAAADKNKFLAAALAAQTAGQQVKMEFLSTPTAGWYQIQSFSN